MNSTEYNPELQKVIAFLQEQRIPFEILPFLGGCLLTVPSEAHREFSLEVHPYSYGGKQGLLESSGCISVGAKVEGWLTGETAIERIKEHYLDSVYCLTEVDT